MANAEWPGYDRLRKRLARLAAIDYDDFIPLGEEVKAIFVEDNRKGILSQQDKDGGRLADTTYRNGGGKKTAARRGQMFGAASGTPKGKKFRVKYRGSDSHPVAVHANGNLTTAEYKRLTGPPLAPRGEESRVIANYEVGYGQDPAGFFVVGRWENVRSTKGRKFLPAHFKGSGRLPRRDIAGIRPWGRAQIRKATNVWLEWLLSGKP